MSEVTEEVLEESTPASTNPGPRMCKGTMPSPLVWFIKFHESPENKSALARKYFTTAGKINDIQSNSNQKYIVEHMLWSEEELDAAEVAIKENFVRGQEAEAAVPGSVGKRTLATTQPGDEKDSLASIAIVREMMSELQTNPDWAEVLEQSITLEEARNRYNIENPRKPRQTAEEVVEEPEEVEEESIDELVS